MKKIEQQHFLVYLENRKLPITSKLRLTQKIYRDGWNTAIDRIMEHITNQLTSQEETIEHQRG